MDIRNQAEREKTAMGRFEVMCELYLSGSKEVKETILSFLSDEEKKTFLEGCGLYHLFTDSAFYRAAETALAEAIYREANATKKKIEFTIC